VILQAKSIVGVNWITWLSNGDQFRSGLAIDMNAKKNTSQASHDYTQGTEWAASSASTISHVYTISSSKTLHVYCYTEIVEDLTLKWLGGARGLRQTLAVLLILTLSCFCVTLWAAPMPATVCESEATCLELVRSAVANEVAHNNDPTKHMFRSRKESAQGSQTRLYVETRDAMAGMTIAYNDKPLTPGQTQGEEGRLEWLESHPEQLKRKHSQEQENADRTLRIVKALPNAFLYQYDGEESNPADASGTSYSFVHLKFRPNPSYQPPSRVEQVLVGMQGVIVIDPVRLRIAKIDGTLFKEVGFGWGILGHLDKGGHFLVEQRDVGNGCWEISHMSLAFTGKILLFKNLSIKSDEVLTDFRRVPDNTTFAQGVEMLRAEEAQLSQTRSAAAEKPEARAR
jgi:hypothetical protein